MHKITIKGQILLIDAFCIVSNDTDIDLSKKGSTYK